MNDAAAVLAVLAVFAALAPAAAGPLPMTGERARLTVLAPACRSQEAVTAAALAIMNSDRAGYARALVAPDAGCIELKPGSTVDVIEVAISGLVKVRPAGFGVAYWMVHAGMEVMR